MSHMPPSLSGLLRVTVVAYPTQKRAPLHLVSCDKRKLKTRTTTRGLGLCGSILGTKALESPVREKERETPADVVVSAIFSSPPHPDYLAPNLSRFLRPTNHLLTQQVTATQQGQ